MATVMIQIPEGLTPYVENHNDERDLFRNALILYQSIHNLTISYGRAAELLGMNKYDLIDLYEKMGIPYYNYDKDELDSELDAYREIKGMSA